MKKSPLEFLWDSWCCLSIVGIWPRFIEPKLICTTRLSLSLSQIAAPLKIVQFTDLHLNRHLSTRYLKKLRNRIQRYSPDIILFTGDFVCGSSLAEKERLKKFLNSLQAPKGCFAILGNHDYEQTVSINENGDYDITSFKKGKLAKGFMRLLYGHSPTGHVTKQAQSLRPHPELVELLNKTPFKLLNNQSLEVEGINLCGLGEYMAGDCLPRIAFENYNKSLPGIILTHNPDSINLLKKYPGDLILSGHTHGAQVNLPWFRDKLCLRENKKLVRGLSNFEEKKIFINRGIGGLIPFRWFSPPELLLLTLEPKFE